MIRLRRAAFWNLLRLLMRVPALYSLTSADGPVSSLAVHGGVETSRVLGADARAERSRSSGLRTRGSMRRWTHPTQVLAVHGGVVMSRVRIGITPFKGMRAWGGVQPHPRYRPLIFLAPLSCDSSVPWFWTVSKILGLQLRI